jgi:hypothetical protein
MPDPTNSGAGGDLVPEAGGHPARLVTTAAEYIRAANHATINARDVLNRGLLAGVHAYDTAGALYLLTSRLPQLCDQLAAVLTWAAGNGTLTGPVGGWLSADAQALAGQDDGGKG